MINQYQERISSKKNHCKKKKSSKKNPGIVKKITQNLDWKVPTMGSLNKEKQGLRSKLV
jgi:hypothetical protein